MGFAVQWRVVRKWIPEAEKWASYVYVKEKIKLLPAKTWEVGYMPMELQHKGKWLERIKRLVYWWLFGKVLQKKKGKFRKEPASSQAESKGKRGFRYLGP